MVQRPRPSLTSTIGLVVVAALVLAACGVNGEEPEPEPEGAAAEDVETEEGEPEEAATPDSGELDRDARLTYVHTFAVDVLDPDALTGGNALPWVFPVYDRLVHQIPGTGELIPGLAVEREFLEDGDVLELRLREGVTFHDGEPFNAEAVVANFERTRDHPTGSVAQSTVRPIMETTVVDEYTVQLRRDPDPAFDVDWALIESRLTENAGMMISPAAFDNPDLDRAPVGAGPFKIVSFDEERALFERFEDYWDPDQVLVQELEIFQTLDNDPRLAGLITGQFDIIQLDPTQIDQAEAEGLEVVPTTTTTMWQIWINHSKPPLDDENVRRAFLLFGIDREALVEIAKRGHGVPSPQPFPPGHIAFHPDYDIDRYAYDPDHARELIEESAYDVPVTIDYMLPNTPMHIQIAEAMQSMLEPAGVNLDFTVVEQPQFARFWDGEFQAVHGRRARVDPLEMLHNTLAADGDSNPGGFNDERIQDLLAEAARLPIGDEREQVIRDLSALGTDTGFYPALFSIDRIWAHRCVVGMDYPVSAYMEFRGVGIEAGCG